MILGIGTDLVEIHRIARAIEKNPRFLQRVFTVQEQAYCQGRSNSAASLAARFAAKEAVSKAFGLGIGRIHWTDIEIVNAEHGQPMVHLTGNCAMIAAEKGVKFVHISLSHTEAYATAMVILEGDERYVFGDGQTNEGN